MKLEFLKTQLELKPTGIGDIFFDDPRIVSKEVAKSYPYVIWDLKSMKSVISWANSSQIKETLTMKAFIIGDYDRRAQDVSMTIEEKWDDLREAFRLYLVKLMTSNYVSITNMSSMTNELFDIGITPDGEIGVSFDVDMTLYCNTAVT